MTNQADSIFQLDGSHGTCGTWANNIVQKGFLPLPGIRGKAVYLWENIGDGDYLKLAKSWYHYCYDNRKYSGQKDQKCAILTANVSCKMSEVLDFNNRALKARIGALVKRITGDSKSVAAISEGYDKAIQLVEKEHNVQAKVIVAPVTGPDQKYCTYYNYNAMGSPGCIIARETGTLNNVKRLTETEVEGVKI